jgi:glycosyltransferase involved in cell wall biosynthesis
MTKRILVFHSPWPLEQSVDSGSKLRPQEMKNAFDRLGLDVISIDGDSAARKKKWKQVQSHLPEIIGLYSELRTIPMALSDPDHIPRHPLMDLRHFRFLQMNGIPTSAFYRDIFWRFSFYSDMLDWYKRWPTKLFYHYEIRVLKNCMSHIFLPSLKMADYFPGGLYPNHISSLPPGSDICDTSNNNPSQTRTLQLLYVGGVLPPVYDLNPMLDAITAINNVSLTLCCRKDEWERASYYYHQRKNISIVHESGKKVNDLFSKTDILLMFWKMNPYLEFAMPVKLFQSLGHGVPIITNANSEMGGFVRDNNIGWCVSTEEELTCLLATLTESPTLVRQKGNNTRTQRWNHSWESRAQQVIDTLARYRPPPLRAFN